MSTGTDADELTFHRSRWTLPTVLAGIGVLWLVAAGLLRVLVFDDPWYDGVVQVPVILVVIVGAPVLDRWQWGRLGQRLPSRARRPYEINISLTGIRPGVRRLRTELAARLGPERSAQS